MSLLIKTNNIKVDGNGPQPEIISLQLIKINDNKVDVKANEAIEKVASDGLLAILVIYLTKNHHIDAARVGSMHSLRVVCNIKLPSYSGGYPLRFLLWSFLCNCHGDLLQAFFVGQVGDFKSLVQVMPIWSTRNVNAITISQLPFPVVQASAIDSHFSLKFEIPSGSLSVFGILALTVYGSRFMIKYLYHCQSWDTPCDRGNCGGWSALGEILQSKYGYRSCMHSAMWLVPQYCLTRMTTAFNTVGQIEFYYSEFPKSSSIEVILFLTRHGCRELGLPMGHCGVNPWMIPILTKGHS
ncbi:protein NRT1/ PTR FAMILY 1.2-like protein [Cinnamomum micranthum f. kanehirae]|uniref:Protein NRT1/ PTR FAMILY 1.2-like protein n=1 Tax=Cinnamomum micranthum f. kanehirae TaxID=337451 RepID=A0A3S3MER3_9MAGN|nr:protein NRT1/ PTR FAMILY 1.2-like protein [Cinnamomum micranthum f. kanehirae]